MSAAAPSPAFSRKAPKGDLRSIREFVHKGVKGARETPWVDGWQLDLEHFPRKDFHPAALTNMVCDIQAGL